MNIIGTELKINVHIDPMDGVHMSECNFICQFFVKNRMVTIKKENMIKVDDDNYIALVDTAKLETGILTMRIEVDVPDLDFSDGFRKEVDIVCTGITLVSKVACQQR